MSVFRVILVRIFPAFSCIWTEYGKILRISPYSVRMWENAGKMRTRTTPNTDSFYVVNVTTFYLVNMLNIFYRLNKMKWESLNLEPNLPHYSKQRSNFQNARFRAKFKILKFGTKSALFECFGQQSPICFKKFHANLKNLKFGTIKF